MTNLTLVFVAWFETLNRNPPPVYYAENMDINI